MSTCVIYARVSSKDQEREGFSIPAQLKMLREYASRKGCVIAREFVDVETAKTTGRKEFGEMLAFFAENPGTRVVLVEKTDRLYRNFRDSLTLEDLGIDIHLVKEGQVIGKDSPSQARLMHNIHVAIAKNYCDNLREEVRKGMREKAAQGTYPSRPPLGYRNNKADHTIEVNPERAPIARRMFELYATGAFSVADVRKGIRKETGQAFPKGYIHKILRSPFYSGFFVWDGRTYQGTHELIISPSLHRRVQEVLAGHNRPKYRKNDFAFSGLLTCAHDNCAITAERKKERYTYYRCTGFRGKCDQPYHREEALGERLGQLLQDIYVPDEVLTQIVSSLAADRERTVVSGQQERQRLQQRLATIRTRLDKAYTDKLDGKISAELWERKSADWQQEERQVLFAIQALDSASPDRLLNAQRILELANKAHFLYVRQKPAEQAKLLRMVLSNCAIDGASLYPTYRKPFDVIFERVKTKEWRALRDSNSRPTGS